MKTSSAGVVLAIGAAAAAASVLIPYERDIGRARTRIRTATGIAVTPSGSLEYADVGHGPTILCIHGAGGGFDQGLLVARQNGLSTEDFRLIAPSRYGYLGTPLPQGPCDPATQADAYASLLDSLKVSEPVVVMGVSAGALSAMQFALRHPRRVKALILLVPASWLMTGAQADTHRQKIGGVSVISSYLLHSDFLCWLGIRVARRKMASFIGVPEKLQATLTEEDARSISEILETILPVSKRADGLANEDKTFAEIKPYPVEHIKVPTLIIDAEDVVTFPGSEFLAHHISNAQLVRFKRGGHLLVGHSSEVRKAIASFLKQLQDSPR